MRVMWGFRLGLHCGRPPAARQHPRGMFLGHSDAPWALSSRVVPGQAGHGKRALSEPVWSCEKCLARETAREDGSSGKSPRAKDR